MRVKRYAGLHGWAIVVLLLTVGLVAACGATENGLTPLPPIQTQLLVRAPDGPLPLGRPIEVRSRTDATDGVSHVELYAVELPGNRDVLIRSDPAPQPQQKSYTISQEFTPRQAGHYVIKVVGYNRQGQTFTSNFIGFDVQ
jgi:hypothetical protein